jgi:hypothetical protein
LWERTEGENITFELGGWFWFELCRGRVNWEFKVKFEVDWGVERLKFLKEVEVFCWIRDWLEVNNKKFFWEIESKFGVKVEFGGIAGSELETEEGFWEDDMLTWKLED